MEILRKVNPAAVIPATFYAKYLPIGDGNRIFVGTSTGVYSTSNLDGYSTVWQLDAPNVMGNVVINMIDTRESDGLVAVGTHAIGVYQANITSLHPAPSVPELLIPTNGSRGISETVRLEWKNVASAAMYTIEIATDADFNDIVYTESEIKSNYTFANKMKAGQNKYYWRVKAHTAGGVTGFTEAWSFITTPDIPELIYPESSQKDLDTNVTFVWEAVSGATRYNLQIATKGGFQGIIVDTIVTDATCTIENLESDSKYFWKVSSGDDVGFGELSKASTFYTKDPSSVEESAGNAFVLYQNFPNPFSKSTHIEFDAKFAANVLLELYSADGKKIETLLDEVVYGRNRVDVNASKLDAGVYYYRLTTSGKTYTKKMVVVK